MHKSAMVRRMKEILAQWLQAYPRQNQVEHGTAHIPEGDDGYEE